MISDPPDIATLVVAGRSRAGKALARNVACRGVDVLWLSGRSVSAGEPPPGRVKTAELLVIAVPDRFIGPAAKALAATLPGEFRAPVLHLSGSLTAGVLAPLRERRIPCASCHPIQTLPRADVSLEGVIFGIEGDPAARRAAARLARLAGGIPAFLKEGDKVLYHLAASIAANGTVALLGLASNLLIAAGFSELKARRALRPLVTQAVLNATSYGAREALTGPVARADEETVERHIQALRGYDPDRLPLLEELIREQRRLLKARSSEGASALRRGI